MKRKVNPLVKIRINKRLNAEMKFINEGDKNGCRKEIKKDLKINEKHETELGSLQEKNKNGYEYNEIHNGIKMPTDDCD